MRYECNLELFNKVILNFKGEVHSLCNNCFTKDCTNPIVNKSISYFGVTSVEKVFMRGDNYYIVTSCEGYSEKKESEDESSEEDL